MGRIKKRDKEIADRLLAKAEFVNEFEHNMPNIFDGTIDKYISWLKYYKRIADKRSINILMHLDGTFKIKLSR